MQELSIIHEDNHLIVVIKPHNLPCCPDSSGDMDLLTMLKEYRKTNEQKSGEAFVGLVHRLDRVTGGVMVYAKTSKAAARLADAMKDGEFNKKYLAVVVGSPSNRVGKLEHYLLKNEKDNKVEIVGKAVVGAKFAKLNYRVMSTGRQVSLVEINLITGRSHQARVQMSSMGTSIFGDVKYGKLGKIGKGNLALWAHELRFNHPTTGDSLKFIVNPPEELPWTQFDFARKEHKHR